MCNNFGTTWDPFNTHVSTGHRRIRALRRHGEPVTPEMQAEIEAEQAANERTALVRRRRASNSLFGGGSSVMGTPAVTGGPAAGSSALGRGGGIGGGGGRAGGR